MQLTGTRKQRFLIRFLLLICSWSMGCDSIDLFRKQELVYVTASALNLRGGPTTRSPRVKLLARGEELKVLEHQEIWLRIRDEEDDEGWVHGNYVGDPEAVRAAFKVELKNRAQAQRTRRSANQIRPKATPGKESVRKPGRFSTSEMLEGFSEVIEVVLLDPIGGEKRSVGTTDNGQVTVEFWGNSENLSRASMMIAVVDVPSETLSKSADFASQFIRNAVPKWKRDGVWMAEKLLELASKDIGEGGFNTSGKQVRFAFVKPLGTVRITVSRNDA